MSVISLVARKGGAGKTTTSCIIAGSVATRGHKVAVIDADYNHSLSNWVEKFDVPIELHRPTDDNGELVDEKIFNLASDLEQKNDLVVIDTAGAASRAAVYAIAQSDLVIVPVMLSDADVTEAMRTFELVDEVRKETKRYIAANLLLTAYMPRTAIASFVDEQVAGLGVPTFKTKLQHLVAFKEMTWNGTVPSRWLAGNQVKNLMIEIIELGVLPFLNIKEFGTWWRLAG